jgi:hypothetical protein
MLLKERYVTGRLGRRRKQLLDDSKETERILETKRGSTRSHCVELTMEDVMDLS